MKFNIGDRVKILKTVDDGRTGRIVGVVELPKYIHLRPETTFAQCKSWANLLEITTEEVANSPVYIIKLDKPAPPISENQAKSWYGDKFMNEADLMAWFNSQSLPITNTIEQDIELISIKEKIPDTIEELLDE